jgi:hypothetical protein
MSPVPALNVSIYKINGDSFPDLKNSVASSGVYTNKRAGVATPLTSMAIGEYLVVPSTHKPELGVFMMTVYSDHPISLEKN